MIYNAYPHFTDTQAFLTAINNNLKKGGEFSIIHSDPPSVINARHSGEAKNVSKDLESADEEANIFKELFDILWCFEISKCTVKCFLNIEIIFGKIEKHEPVNQRTAHRKLSI